MSPNPDFTTSKMTSSPNESVLFARKVIASIKPDLHLFDFGTTLFNCIRTESAEGHTPGHPLLTIFSKQEELKHTVDVFHTSLLIAKPEWGTQWDTDFQKAVRTRVQVINNLVNSRKLMLSCHLPWPGLGYVVKDREGHKWVPKSFSTPQLYEKGPHI